MTKDQIKKSNPTVVNLYKKKINRLIAKILLYVLIILILISFIFGLNIYHSTLTNLDQTNIKELENYINIIQGKTSEVSNNLSLARKYNEIWKNASEEQKSNKGISLETITLIINDLAKKYHIIKYDFKMSVPQKIENNVFKNKSLEVVMSKCDISFKATDDIRVMSFLEELEDKLPGYVVIRELSLNKTQDYNHSNFVSISTGGDAGAISTNISFEWYTTRKQSKEKEIKDE